MTVHSATGAQYLEGLLRRVVASPEILAAFAGEPGAAGAPRPHAEVELWLVAEGGFGERLGEWLLPLGETAFAGEVDGRFCLVTVDGLLIHILAVTGIEQVPATGLQLLVNRSGGLPGRADAPAPDLERAAGRFWLGLYRAALALGSGAVLSAHGELERCRVHLLDLYRLALAPERGGSGWAGADQLPSGRLVSSLAEWLVCPLQPEAQWRCAHRLATTFESLILPLTERLGVAYPWAMRNLAFRSLDESRPGSRPTGEPGLPVPEKVPVSEGPKTGGPARFKVKARRQEP